MSRYKRDARRHTVPEKNFKITDRKKTLLSETAKSIDWKGRTSRNAKFRKRMNIPSCERKQAFEIRK